MYFTICLTHTHRLLPCLRVYAIAGQIFFYLHVATVQKRCDSFFFLFLYVRGAEMYTYVCMYVCMYVRM